MLYLSLVWEVTSLYQHYFTLEIHYQSWYALVAPPAAKSGRASSDMETEYVKRELSPGTLFSEYKTIDLGLLPFACVLAYAITILILCRCNGSPCFGTLRGVVCTKTCRTLLPWRILHTSGVDSTFLQSESWTESYGVHSVWKITAGVLLVVFQNCFLFIYYTFILGDKRSVPTLFKVFACTEQFATRKSNRCYSKVSGFCN